MLMAQSPARMGIDRIHPVIAYAGYGRPKSRLRGFERVLKQVFFMLNFLLREARCIR